MTKIEAEEIIKKEELKRLNWYNQDELRENQVGIMQDNGMWKVYATDERANIVETSIVECVTESDALEIFIKKAKKGKIIFG